LKLDDFKKTWDRLGQTDPFWAILGEPEKKGGRWQVNEFFATGIAEIGSLMQWISSLGVSISHRRALDFGCGVGRLTQALAEYFDEVYGVDIAPSMIKLAEKYNLKGYRCRFYMNDTENLNIFPDNQFDLIYSNLTLQHIHPRYYNCYVREFLRTLSASGLLIFHVPDEPVSLRAKLRQFAMDNTPGLLNVSRKIRFGETPIMEVYGMSPKDVGRLLQEKGARVVRVDETPVGSLSKIGFARIWRYCAAKERG
jgi:ubiquinone/menaquinone biosynthesis C-methylase UbiE